MEKKSLSYGSFLLILGFIIYEFGLFIALDQIPVFIDLPSIELIGILLQLSGGAIAIAGFVSTVSNIVSIKLENDRSRLMDEILSRLEERIVKMTPSLIAQNVSAQASQSTRSCRFCGAKLGKEDIFCTSCGKSQE